MRSLSRRIIGSFSASTDPSRISGLEANLRGFLGSSRHPSSYGDGLSWWDQVLQRLLVRIGASADPFSSSLVIGWKTTFADLHQIWGKKAKIRFLHLISDESTVHLGRNRQKFTFLIFGESLRVSRRPTTAGYFVGRLSSTGKKSSVATFILSFSPNLLFMEVAGKSLNC